MSDDGFLAKYSEGEGGSSLSMNRESDPWEDLGCFGWLRGNRDRALMLECRKRDGRILALGYSWLERVVFDPSAGIVLTFAGQDVHVVGRNLNQEVRPNLRLFEGLTRHRVPWLAEASRPISLRAPEDACLIEEIRWQELG